MRLIDAQALADRLMAVPSDYYHTGAVVEMLREAPEVDPGKAAIRDAEKAVKKLSASRPAVIEGEPGAEWELGVQYGLRLAAEALRRLREGDSDAGAD